MRWEDQERWVNEDLERGSPGLLRSRYHPDIRHERLSKSTKNRSTNLFGGLGICPKLKARVSMKTVDFYWFRWMRGTYKDGCLEPWSSVRSSQRLQGFNFDHKLSLYGSMEGNERSVRSKPRGSLAREGLDIARIKKDRSCFASCIPHNVAATATRRPVYEDRTASDRTAT